MNTPPEKMTTVNVPISEDLAVFASEYAALIGMPLDRLLCKELRRCLKITRAKVRELPFTNLDHLMEARENAIILATAEKIKHAQA
jgi:hypothetical protein